MTTRLTFPSGGERCAAWLTLPQAAAPHPVVLLIHGGGATHAMMLDQYERWFSQAGFAVRVALWGTSFGASHVVATAARRRDIAAAVIQCPILQGRAPALSGGLGHLLRFTGPIVSDLLRAALGLGRRYVQIVGRPGELAFVNVAGAYDGWMSVVPPGVTFDGRITAGAGLSMLLYDAAARARQVRCPLLVCVSDRENLMKPE